MNKLTKRFFIGAMCASISMSTIGCGKINNNTSDNTTENISTTENNTDTSNENNNSEDNTTEISENIDQEPELTPLFEDYSLDDSFEEYQGHIVDVSSLGYSIVTDSGKYVYNNDVDELEELDIGSNDIIGFNNFGMIELSNNMLSCYHTFNDKLYSAIFSKNDLPYNDVFAYDNDGFEPFIYAISEIGQISVYDLDIDEDNGTMTLQNSDEKSILPHEEDTWIFNTDIDSKAHHTKLDESEIIIPFKNHSYGKDSEGRVFWIKSDSDNKCVDYYQTAISMNADNIIAGLSDRAIAYIVNDTPNVVYFNESSGSEIKLFDKVNLPENYTVNDIDTCIMDDTVKTTIIKFTDGTYAISGSFSTSDEHYSDFVINDFLTNLSHDEKITHIHVKANDKTCWFVDTDGYLYEEKISL